MDKTKSKLAAFFDNEEDESSLPPRTVDDAKLSQYTSGKVRKSRREKELEAAEAKKREEEANAARAYREFLDAFESDDVGRKAGSSFIRSSAESGTAYAPSRGSLDQSARLSSGTKPDFRSPSPPLSNAPKPKGKRAMDSFLEEIKREQAEREAKYGRHAHGRSVTALAAYDSQSGSKDRGDPLTSNIFVANLPSHVTEQTLGHFFARVGPVGSVKVMWPRSDGSSGPGSDMTTSRRNRNSGLSGFVSFMKRKDAETALREFDGYDWGGSVLRVGWSKAVPMANKPMYVASGRSKFRSSRSRSRSRSRSHYHHHYDRSRSSSWDRSRSRSPRRHRSRSLHHNDSRSRSPRQRRRSHSHSPHGRFSEEETVTDTFIRAVAAEVKGHDKKYEEFLREKEKNNAKYGFLQRGHRRHAFYRGLVESEKVLEPEFDDEGYNSVYSTDSAEESERERTRKTVLSRLARKRFESMLRALSGKRGEIARCMSFCLEHAEAAPEVADIMVASLLVDGTAVPRKVARLHLICDILHNSAATVPSAWKFRLEFQSRLGIVFDHLANIYHSFPGRITAETFKKQITSVVDIWEDWIVFPPDFTSELRSRLDGAFHNPAPQANETPKAQEKADDKYQSRFTSSTFQAADTSAFRPASSVPDESEPMEMDSDIDGQPVDDIDGEPIDDIDGEPIDDIDGVPIDDIDGEPIDDVDGEPLQE